ILRRHPPFRSEFVPFLSVKFLTNSPNVLVVTYDEGISGNHYASRDVCAFSRGGISVAGHGQTARRVPYGSVVYGLHSGGDFCRGPLDERNIFADSGREHFHKVRRPFVRIACGTFFGRRREPEEALNFRRNILRRGDYRTNSRGNPLRKHRDEIFTPRQRLRGEAT